MHLSAAPAFEAWINLAELPHIPEGNPWLSALVLATATLGAIGALVQAINKWGVGRKEADISERKEVRTEQWAIVTAAREDTKEAKKDAAEARVQLSELHQQLDKYRETWQNQLAEANNKYWQEYYAVQAYKRQVEDLQGERDELEKQVSHLQKRIRYLEGEDE